MGDAGATTLTTLGGRADQRSTSPFLFLVLRGHRPAAPTARLALGRVDSVAVGRGSRFSAQLVREGKLKILSVQLDDPRMSTEHARLDRALGTWMLKDDGSKNGTFVNGEQVSRTELSDGDVLELGHTFFLFRSSLPEVEDAPLVLTAEELEPPAEALSTLSPALARELSRVPAIAGAEVPVIIDGETGTGKELAARALHALSGREGRFVTVNCGAIPETLTESELFGHVKGAFSGALQDRPGHVREADGGTLFLDEVGDLPASSQAALLRVLQEGEVVPVGSSRPTVADVRIVAATHRDLESMVRAGTFREDLLARLAGFRLTLPPLRDRREDFGLLVGALLRSAAPDRADDIAFARPAARALLAHDWPRNVRELENCLRTAAALAGDTVTLDDLPALTRRTGEPEATLSPEDEALRETVVAALRAHRGNVSAAARELGKGRTQIQRWIKRFGLNPRAYR